MALRGAGAQIGDGVDLGEGSLVVAPRVVVEDGVRLGPRATVVCEEVVAIGELSQFGADLELRCRRAYLGAGIWGGRSVRIGGGGHRDPWATLTIGDLAFVGDEAFVNVCRPVLIGREVFLTMRSLIVTHNIGHSVLEGFENRFAPVVLEDRSQVGLGAVLYAGARIGAEAIVASNSYVVGEIPAGSFAIGVPAKATGSSSHKLSDARRVDLARRFVDDLHELLALRGHDVSAIENDGFEIEGTRVAFVRELSRWRRCAGGGARARRPWRRPRGCRRPRPSRPSRARERGRCPRLGARVLPQARNQVRAGAVELPRRPRLNGGIGVSPW